MKLLPLGMGSCHHQGIGSVSHHRNGFMKVRQAQVDSSLSVLPPLLCKAQHGVCHDRDHLESKLLELHN